ncbi:hypothetical protein M3197_12170 [Sporosarcina aquimarina]|uniref:hypothetical protein n=1 Tax=Sporosarcina aquimarina TaxID=114975 RepID=UPI00203FE30F|nr:hypothetical protein [Sporosarcina aquimarina]MCM3758219.1 hypothetical protein [Sporosarcina aquimarina]
MKQLLIDNIDDLDFNSEKIQNIDKYDISGFQKTISAVNNLRELNFLKIEIHELSQLSNIYYDKSINDHIRVDGTSYNEFKRLVNIIKHKCSATLEAFDQAIPDQQEYSISVRLPDYKDLDQLSKFFSKLNKSLEQAIVNEHVKGNVTIQNFDSGSLWVELILGGHFALQFVGALTRTAAAVRNQTYQLKIIEQHVRTLEIKNDTLEDLQKGLSKSVDVLVEAETKNLLDQENIQYDSEYLGQLKYSVKTLAELINDGTEIHPSYLAEPEYTADFPDFDKLDQIESTIKQIESSTEE